MLINTKELAKSKYPVIGFCGVVGSGKDYQTNLLMQESKDFTKIDFADSVREVCWNLLDWKPKDDKEYESFKKRYISSAGLGNTIGRQFLINVGDGLRKQFGNNIWTDAWLKKLPFTFEDLASHDTNDIIRIRPWKKQIMSVNMNNRIVVSDVRYRNELNLINALGGKTIFCNYKSNKYNANIESDSEKLAQSCIDSSMENMQIVE